jgi:hypothetical protein
MSDPEEVTMGTDPTPPGDEPQPTPPGTDAPAPDTTPPPAETPPAPGPDTPPPDTGTEPAPPPVSDPAPPPPESDTSGEGEVVEETTIVEEEVVEFDPDAEGVGEPLGRATTLSDDVAPAGHVQPDADGNPRQHADSNPELGVAPDTLADTPSEAPPTPGEFEPEPVDIDRPDVGTPVTDTPPEGSVTESPAEEE